MKMKKLLALFLGASMLLSSATAINASAVTTDKPATTVSHDARGASGTTDSGLLWDLTDGVLTISTNGTDTAMGSDRPWNTSQYRSTITSVVIENGVTSIGDSAFSSCTSLTSVTIGNSVTSIGAHAFQNCTSLTSVSIPNSVTSIRDEAFSLCENLTSVTIPDSVTSIGDAAFRGCANLTSVTIGNSVTSIRNDAFYNCTSLTEINVDSENQHYSSEDGILFNKEKTELVTYPEGKTLSSYTIPDSVTSIGNSAFRSCDNLTSVTIPDSVTSIGDDAFSFCSSLTSVTIPNSVKSLGDYAFFYCSNLQNVIFEEGSVLESIGTEDC